MLGYIKNLRATRPKCWVAALTQTVRVRRKEDTKKKLQYAMMVISYSETFHPIDADKIR
jgi:hypothetical protein